MSNYKDKFEPWIEYSYEEKKDICSSNYIEVGRECYHYEGLRNKKNSILVYSAILAGLNNEMSDTFSYTNKVLADRLAMDDIEVRRAIKDLEEIELVKVTHPTKNKRNIKIIKDLRYPPQKLKKHKSKKSVIKVYDRIFFYSLITKPMVHVYSYYLALTSIPNYPGFSSTSYKKVADSLGYSEKQIMTILKKMEDIKLVKIVRHSNQKAVKIEVDFSKKQQEEMDYENMLEKQRQVYYEKLVNV